MSALLGTLTKYFLFCIFFLIQQFVLSISNCKCNTNNQHLQDKCNCNYVPIPHLHYILKGNLINLISKGLFRVFVSTKKRTKIFLYFCPSLQKDVKTFRHPLFDSLNQFLAWYFFLPLLTARQL